MAKLRLTKCQREILASLAKRASKVGNKVRLFESDSLSGASWTLRYRHDFVEYGRYGPRARYRTGHILGVVIPDRPDDKDGIQARRQRFEALARLAREEFAALAEALGQEASDGDIRRATLSLRRLLLELRIQ